MHITKGSFKLDNEAGGGDNLSGWFPFTPLNLLFVPVAAIAIFFVENLWLFVLSSLVLAFIFYKKIKEEFKPTDSLFLKIAILILSAMIFSFCIIIFYKMGGYFREAGIL